MTLSVQDQVVADLHQLALCRSLGAYHSTSFPSLEKVATTGNAGPATHAQIREAVLRAVESLPDSKTRDQGRALFPFSDDWWDIYLGARQTKAAQVKGMQRKSYIDKRADGSSHYLDVLAAIAGEMIGSASSTTSDGATVMVGERTVATEVAAARRRHPRWVVLAGVVLILAALLLSSAITVSRSDKDPEDAARSREGRSAAIGTSQTTPSVDVRTAPEPCSIAVGDGGQELAVADASTLEGLRAQLEALVPEEACASGPTHYFVDALVQDIRIGDEPAGVLLISPTGAPVYLPEATWQSYRQIIAGDAPEAAAFYAGYPDRIERDTERGGLVVFLTNGGLLVGVDDVNQAFWVPKEALPTWEGTGGVNGTLGYPTTNPFIDHGTGAYAQEYEGGVLRSLEPAPARGPIEVVEAPNPGQQIRALGDIRGRIIGQRTTTSWFVDGSGRRRWIPDPAVFNCLGGDRILAADGLPGYEVWTLPLGPPAVCDGE